MAELMPDESLAPQWDVRVEIHIDAAKLVWLSERDLRGSYNPYNQQYEPLGRVSWKFAADLLQGEGELIRGAAEHAGKPEEFMDALETVAEEHDFFGLAEQLVIIDHGVVAAVAVLAASGCTTFDSCAGASYAEGVVPPHVLFYVPRRHRSTYIELLQKAAKASGTGLLNSVEGRLELFGTSIMRMWRFAEEFLELAMRSGLPRAVNSAS